MTAFDAELITGLVRWQNDGRVPLTSDDRFDFAAWLIGQLGNFIILLLDRRMGQIEEFVAKGLVEAARGHPPV